MSAKAVHALVKAEKWPEAWHAVNALLNESPESPELLYLAGTVLRSQGHIGMSLPLFAKALSKDQGQPNLWMHYAATLHDLNEWDDAIRAFQVVEQMCPTDAMPPANISASLSQKGQWRDCINAADKALSLDPDNYIAHISKSFACLALGRWNDGWKHAEHLYGKHLVTRIYRPEGQEEPAWDGSKGQTVVVQADQGVGDIIMFSQCLPELILDSKQVIVECAERLAPLIRRNFPGVTVYGTIKSAGQDWYTQHDIDAHVHISSLGRWYRKADKEFPRKAYITPDAEKVAKWKAWLAELPRPWIGVSWKGGIQRTQAHMRSLQLEQLAPVLRLPGSFIDLSYRDNGDEIARWNIRGESQVIVPPADQSDYEDTIALLAALDEVVTVTTAVVHACGAIGRTARVLVQEVPMWRYAHRCGEGMIWYPENSVRMYRRVAGETGWEPAIGRLVKDLRPELKKAE